MIVLTQAQKDILDGKAPGFVAVLIQITIGTEVLRMSSLVFDWVDDASNTWVAGAGILSVGQSFTRAGLVGGAMSITWSGASAELMAAARDADFLGAPFLKQIATIGEDGAQVGDLIFDFSGECELPVITPDPQGPQISVPVENTVIKLRRNHGFQYTPTNHARFFPNDTFFDFIAGLQDKDILDDD